jgi:hypothetical protein
MVEFYLITLSAIPFNNHLTKIIKNMGNWDKFARIKGEGEGLSFKQKYRALKKNKNIIFYE